jgi:hypothetical protein
VGDYEMRPGRVAEIRMDEDAGALTIRSTGTVRYRLYAEADDRFFLKRAPWRIAFNRDGDGQVAGFVLDMDGREIRGVRLD